MISTLLLEEENPPKLPVIIAPEIKEQIDLIREYNQHNINNLREWEEYLKFVIEYISQRKIAWDYVGKYTQSKGTVHIKDDKIFGIDVEYVIKVSSDGTTNYVYIIYFDLKPQRFELKNPFETEN